MTRRPRATRVLFASLLSATALLPAACSSVRTPRVDDSPSPSPTTAALTDAQAQAALITEAELGAPWGPTAGTATWRDGLLKAQAQTESPDCQRFLDALYADELLGEQTGVHAAVGFDDDIDEAQLRYQVIADRPADANRALDWLRTLPQACPRFTAATTRAGEQTVQIGEATLPDVGDARQALRVTLSGETDDGEQTTLTLDVAAVRVGDDAITLTNGGPGSVPVDATNRALQLGVQRLRDIHTRSRTQA